MSSKVDAPLVLMTTLYYRQEFRQRVAELYAVTNFEGYAERLIDWLAGYGYGACIGHGKSFAVYPLSSRHKRPAFIAISADNTQEMFEECHTVTTRATCRMEMVRSGVYDMAGSSEDFTRRQQKESEALS